METRTIPLTKGYVAVVDADDFEWLSAFKWSALVQRKGKNVYAVRSEQVDGKRKHVRMHCALKPGHPIVDHIDGDSLNNRRTNLRGATNQQNVFNQPRPVTNTSGAKGVAWSKSKDRWRAYVTLNQKQHHVGYFTEFSDAEAAVKAARRRLHGEYARDL